MEFIVTLLLPFLSIAAPSAAELLAKWKDAIYTKHEHSKLQLSLVEPGETATHRQAEVWYKSSGPQNAKIMIKFISPTSIRGVAFLSLRSKKEGSSDQWLYLPAYKKARRLSSHGRDESFLDSDFTNGDISFDYENAFDFTVKGKKKIRGKDAYVVEGVIKPERAAGLAYSKEILYISDPDHLNQRTEFFDAKNTLVKTIDVMAWKKYGDRWAADKIVVENQLTKHQSILEFSSRNLQEPPDRKFTLSELESGR